MQNKKLKILLIEDDLLSRLSLKSRLEAFACVTEATNSEEAMLAIQTLQFDFAFVDLDLERELLGLTLIKELKKKDVHSVVLSGREDDKIIEQAYNLGCKDFLSKPFTKASIDAVIKRFNNTQNNLLNHLKLALLTEDTDLEIQLKTIEKALYGDHPILLTGESGTGKTYLAKFIHDLVGKEKPFIHLNCSEISESLLESELFGHEKGAFTGALKTKKGLIELADGGVLFLDEIATLSLGMQKKLLKAIEEKTFYPVGSEKIITSHFRLISATCEDLRDKVKKGEFREDFLFRLDGFNVCLKPLRERKNDLNNLINFFLKKNKRRIVLSTDARNEMLNYSWPGNIRELQKVVEILRSSEKGIVEKNDLKELLQSQVFKTVDSINYETIKKIGLNAYIELIEAQVVQKVLSENNDKVRKTLTDLKLSNNSFYRIMTNIKGKELINVEAQ